MTLDDKRTQRRYSRRLRRLLKREGLRKDQVVRPSAWAVIVLQALIGQQQYGRIYGVGQ
jgi:hypothetical protein